MATFTSYSRLVGNPGQLKHTLLLLTILNTLSGCAQTQTSATSVQPYTLSEKFLTDEWLGTAVLNDTAYLAIPDSLKTVDSLTHAYIGMIVPFIRELDPNGKDTLMPTWMIDGYWSGTWKLENDSLVFTDDDEIIGSHKYSVRIINHDKIELKRLYIHHETDKQEVEYVFMERQK